MLRRYGPRQNHAKMSGTLMHAVNQPEVATKPQARSRLTNGSAVVLADGRSSWARRKRDLIELHLADLGGVENTSEAERAIEPPRVFRRLVCLSQAAMADSSSWR